MNTLIEIKNLKKIFIGTGHHGKGGIARITAVDRVDLTIHEGEHLGLVGESGSGKSTLARLILKLYRADSGEILMGGSDIVKLSQRDFRRLRRDVQMVFQDPYSSLDPRLTVRKILKEAVALLPEKETPHQQLARMAEALQAVGLSIEALPRFSYEFSGGERQRIAIARALIMRPKLLILDEAVSSLDVLVQAQIMELLKKLQVEFGLTYLFITHNLKVVRTLCQRIAVMYQGKIVESAPTEELFRRPLHPYTKRLLAAAVDYQTLGHEEAVVLSKNLRLIDKGNGHFVLE
ncbi:MAG TPA: ATP-binding cassette domain-containing protein [Candidatus Bathyarchaeia archaeon]|nr:ATP-binding cassette domain-containing protein [Candidatus Bathyarchaeia archaeon]